MGDIADMLVDNMVDEGFWFGRLRPNAPAKCKHCGARIQWKQEDRWRAYTIGGKHHVCKPFLKTIRPTPEQDFG